jgi:SEC-C motif-containing protein
MNDKEQDQTCPCGSGVQFADCCEQIINGQRESQTAEELMRARYAAFATGAIDFIVASTHSRTRPEIDIQDIREWSQTSTWRGLEIIDTKNVDDDQAYVSFEAQFTQAGKDLSHKEKALFERELGNWRFLTGTELKNPTVRYETPRTGRNEPCPCGSGRKYKKCCGA